MSAIWGHIDYLNKESSVATMAAEYRRKCKLDSVDETGFKNALLGFGLQIINEEDRHEKAPYLADGGDTAVLADCVLDNREELIAELWGLEKGAEAKESDIPSGLIIARAYERWGVDFTQHLRGLFSVAIYNFRDGKLFLCVDQCACRCLNYHVDGAGCTFSTLLSPIKQAVPEIAENEDYITDFLCIPGLLPNITATETPLKDVYLVEAGCSVLIDTKEPGKAPVITRYYKPETIRVSRNIGAVRAQFLEAYGKAVKSAVRTDGKVAMALSGGFDSSSVAALAATELAQAGKKLNSYTYVPFYKEEVRAENPSYFITDESEDVKAIAAMYPNIETHFEDDGGEDFTVSLDELIDVMEVPFKAFVNLHTLLNIYKKSAASGAKVFLNGQCGNASISFGDIDSAAYHLHRKKRFLSCKRYFKNFCKLVGRDANAEYRDFIEYIKAEAVTGSEEISYKDMMSPFITSEAKEQYDLYKRAGIFIHALERGSVTLKEDYVDVLYSPVSYAYIGAMETKLGLHTGMIIRDATRDVDVLNFCNSVPFEFFAYAGTPRYLIRGFMKDLLPNRILYPILKSGQQSTDWIHRLNAHRERALKLLNETMEELGESDSLAVKRCLNDECVREFLKEHQTFDKDKEDVYTYLFIVTIWVKYLTNSES